MKNKYKCTLRFASLAIIQFLSISLQAQNLKVGAMFSDNAILQQGIEIPVYGTADAGKTVTVTFGKHKAKAKADAEGNWIAYLPKQTASFEGKTLIVLCGKEKKSFSNILVGEVWVAAGQSNMQYTMELMAGFQKPYKGEDLCAEELKKPANDKIRVFNCGRRTQNCHWAIADGQSLRHVSAPGYFCVKNLSDSLNVPVGVISNAIGGTLIEGWLSDGGQYKDNVKNFVPYGIKGFLWYQGEQNCTAADHEYVSKFMRLAKEWRKAFTGKDNQDLPFITVMLSPYTYSGTKHRAGYVDSEELPMFRMQQMECLDSVSNTEIIFNPDLVDDLRDIHYSYKWEVGRRLALVALNKCYGRSELEFCGPRAVKAEPLIENNTHCVKVSFNHIGNGIIDPAIERKSKYGTAISNFELCGEDGIWHAANAIFNDKESVKVWSRYIQNPKKVRYLWNENAKSLDIKNSEGFCAFPFVMNVK